MPPHRFKKGDPRPPGAGRKPGQLNYVTKAVKDFLRETAEDPAVQQAFKSQILAGDKGSMAAFLGVVAHVLGKPKETVEVSTTPSMAKLLVMALSMKDEKP